MAAPGDVLEVAILRIGAQGDGIARHGAASIYVPLALPGERWRVRLAARRGEGFAADALALLGASRRQPPPCRHFGACGGCQLQHLPAADYARWQQRTVEEALARRGLGEVAIAPIELTPPASRRRVRLAFTRAGGKVLLGFRERLGHRLVDVLECPIARPEIVALLAPLRRLLARLPMARQAGELLLTASASGLDLLLQTAAAPGLADREALAGFAADHDLARLAWRPGPDLPAEPIAARRAALADFAGIAVALPPGAFLQPSAAAERALRAAVADALGDARRIADLFAGCGTLGLPLAAAGRTRRRLRRRWRDARGRGAGRPPRRLRRPLRDHGPRPRARAARRRRARAPRRRDPRPAARRRARPGRGPRGRAGRQDRAGLLQPRDLRARRPHAGRRRLPAALGAPARRVPLVRADRAGRRLRAPWAPA